MSSYKLKSKQLGSPPFSMIIYSSPRSPMIHRSPTISSKGPLEVPSDTLPRSPLSSLPQSPRLSSTPKESGSLTSFISSFFSSPKPSTSPKKKSSIQSPSHKDLIDFRYNCRIDNFPNCIQLLNRIIGPFVGFEPVACEYEINGKVMETDNGDKTYYFTDMNDVANLLEEIKEKLNLLLATKVFCSNESKYNDVCNVYFYSNKGGDLHESVIKTLPYYPGVKAHGVYVKTEFDNPDNSFTTGFFFRPIQQRPDIIKFFQ